MKKSGYHQCELVRENPLGEIREIAYIPEKFAVEGLRLKIKNGETWEDGWKVVAKQEHGKLHLIKERLNNPSWRWVYRFGEKKNLSIAIES